MANGHDFEAKELELLKQVYAQGFKHSANLLSTILHCKVQILPSEALILSAPEIGARLSAQHIVLKLNISNDFHGHGFMVLPTNVSLVLCDILTGRNGKNPSAQLGEPELSMLSQFMLQFLNSLSVVFSQILTKKVVFSGAGLKLSVIGDELTSLGNGDWVMINSRLNLENIIEEQFVQILPLNVAKEFALISRSRLSKAGQNVEPLTLSPLDKIASFSGSQNLGSLLVDVPLQLNVELGKVRMMIKEILELGVGSIIELDRLAGEPVDIMLNNKLLAKGEVVVIDENLGVRLTTIISKNDRI
jgi:flagellar motor switch protein FliN/FliY